MANEYDLSESCSETCHLYWDMECPLMKPGSKFSDCPYPNKCNP